MFKHIGNTEKAFFRDIFKFVLKYKKICMSLDLNIIENFFQLDEIIKYYSKKISLNYVYHDKSSLEYLYLCKTILKYFIKNNVVLEKDIDFVIEAEIQNHLVEYFDYDSDKSDSDLDYLESLFKNFEKFFNIKFYHESTSYLAVEGIPSSHEHYKIFQSLIAILKHDIGNDATYDDYYSFYSSDTYVVAINAIFSEHIIKLINLSFPILSEYYNYCYSENGYTYFLFNEMGFEWGLININSIILIILGYLEIYLNKSYESHFSL